MDPDDPCCPLVDDFFERLGAERSRATRARLVRVRLALVQLLGDGPLDAGTVLRHVPRLVDEACLPTSFAAARAHLSVARRLIDHLEGEGVLDVVDARGSVQRARERLERRVAEAGPDARADRIPARLLAHRILE